MAFVERTENLPEGSDVVQVWANNVFPEGNMESRQFVRKRRSGHWEIDINVNFIKFVIPLQEHQAKRIIEGGWSGEDNAILGFQCAVIDEIRNVADKE